MDHAPHTPIYPSTQLSTLPLVLSSTHGHSDFSVPCPPVPWHAAVCPAPHSFPYPHLSIQPPTYLPFTLPSIHSPLIRLSFIYPFIHPPIQHPSIHLLSIHPSIHHPSIIHPPIHHLSIHPSSTHPSIIYPSTYYPSIHHPSVIHPPIHHPSIIHPSSTHPSIKIGRAHV